MAQVALLHTDMNSGFKFCPKIGRNSAIKEYANYQSRRWELRWMNETYVSTEGRAENMLSSNRPGEQRTIGGLRAWDLACSDTTTALCWMQQSNARYGRRGLPWDPTASPAPQSWNPCRVRQTGPAAACWPATEFILKESVKEWMNDQRSLTMCWLSVCSTSEMQRRKTGSQYGRKPDWRAVATDDRHSNRGKRSLSSSFRMFHLVINGGINKLM